MQEVVFFTIIEVIPSQLGTRNVILSPFCHEPSKKEPSAKADV